MKPFSKYALGLVVLAAVVGETSIILSGSKTSPASPDSQVAVQPVQCPAVDDIGPPASSPARFAVKFAATVQGDLRKPMIGGRTNLPVGTKLFINLERKASAYKAQSDATVGSDGCFSGGPFTQSGEPINPGDYAVEVLMPLSSGQPQSVQNVIGDRGQNIAGPLVKSFPAQSRHSLGKIAEYRTSFTAGTADARADAEAQQKATDGEKKRLADARWAAALSAVRTLKVNLRNPSSADWASVYTNKDGNVVCIILRAQNGFGGMSVERYVSVDQKFRDEAPSWNKKCAGDGFHDFTRLIRQIE